MVSHQIIVQLCAGQDKRLAETFNVAVDALASLPDCIHYGLSAHPDRLNTWTIRGDWACLQAMNEHLQSAALQQLLGDLCALRPYCLEFNCQPAVPDCFSPV